MKNYDLIVLGAGSGNMLPPEGFDGWKIAIVEPDRFGGTCLNRGCVPSKMFVYTADMAQHVREAGRFDIDAGFEKADWPAIRDRIFGQIDPLHDKAVAYRRTNGIDVYTDEAHFVGERTVQVGTETISAERIVIATGSRPSVPQWPGIDNVRFHTSDDIMRIESLPKSMVIVGGGYIAAEMAHIFSALGTNVTIVVRGEAMLAQRDFSVRDRYTDMATKQYDIKLRTDVLRVGAANGRTTVAIRHDNGTERTLETDTLLVATGRVPNTDRLQPGAGGIELDDRNRIKRDSTGATTSLGVWAFGDAANHYQLKHMANAEARIIWHNVVNPAQARRLEFKTAPSAVFGSPQTASVGKTEQELQASGRNYGCAFRGYEATAYGWAMRNTTGFVKILIDNDTRLILGAHVLGPQAPLLLQPLVQAMALDNTVNQVANDVIYIHPALSEVVEQALLELV